MAVSKEAAQTFDGEGFNLMQSIIVLIYKKGDKTDCSNYSGLSLLPTRHKVLSNILLSKLTPYQRKLLGIVNVDFDATGQLLIVYYAFLKYLRKIWNTTKHCTISL